MWGELCFDLTWPPSIYTSQSGLASGLKWLKLQFDNYLWCNYITIQTLLALTRLSNFLHNQTHSVKLYTATPSWRGAELKSFRLRYVTDIFNLILEYTRIHLWSNWKQLNKEFYFNYEWAVLVSLAHASNTTVVGSHWASLNHTKNTNYSFINKIQNFWIRSLWCT